MRIAVTGLTGFIGRHVLSELSRHKVDVVALVRDAGNAKPKKGDHASIYTLPLHFKKVLKGSHGGSAMPHVDIPNYLRLVQAGKMNLVGLITHEFKLDSINEAIELVRSGNTGRVVLAMDDTEQSENRRGYAGPIPGGVRPQLDWNLRKVVL
ncbi:MAG: NAD-dependent epimerase/dehydratase family protein [Syntrophales bacterium LBB04]|nr:NAD-dependent epimerase/dehydratase family protein [Syntrophales bacterium LBB04]